MWNIRFFFFVLGLSSSSPTHGRLAPPLRSNRLGPIRSCFCWCDSGNAGPAVTAPVIASHYQCMYILPAGSNLVRRSRQKRHHGAGAKSRLVYKIAGILRYRSSEIVLNPCANSNNRVNCEYYCHFSLTTVSNQSFASTTVSVTKSLKG